MLSTKSAVYTAPAIAERVVEFRNDGDSPAVCTVENLSTTNSAALKYQESSNGTTWSDIAGSTVTVNPGLSNTQLVVAAQSRIALHIGGNLQVQVHIARVVNGAPDDLGSAA